VACRAARVHRRPLRGDCRPARSLPVRKILRPFGTQASGLRAAPTVALGPVVDRSACASLRSAAPRERDEGSSERGAHSDSVNVHPAHSLLEGRQPSAVEPLSPKIAHVCTFGDGKAFSGEVMNLYRRDRRGAVRSSKPEQRRAPAPSRPRSSELRKPALELWFDRPNGESATAVSECRTRVLLHRDGSFECSNDTFRSEIRWARR